MQLYLTPRHNANAFASTFLFFATHKANAEKIKKSLQASAPRQTKMDRHNTTEKEQRTANSTLPKVAVQYTADTFVINQSMVLRMNICGKNRHLRQAPNRQVVKIHSTNFQTQ